MVKLAQKKKGFEVVGMIRCVEQGKDQRGIQFSHSGSRADIIKAFRKSLAQSAGEK